MPAKLRPTIKAFIEQYRCDDRYGEFKVSSTRSAEAGYFLFGQDAVCYGRSSIGNLRKSPEDGPHDVLLDINAAGGDVVLPFDPDEVIANLRCERYVQSATGTGAHALAKKAYYGLRPLMPVRLRKHVQRIYLKNWRQIAFPRWPVDRTVETIFERLLQLSFRSHPTQRIPFVWFWPDGCSSCVIVTHDIETEAGRGFATTLADLDASFGVKSAFQVVPEERYEVSPGFLDSLRVRGCEVNLHGLNHDGQLFRDRQEFARQVKQINRYAREYGSAGFRSPVMYRNVEWFDALEFSYDMSIPNVAHLDPQRGGCCSVMPYFIGNILELPLTTTQDYALYNILGDRSIALWKQQIEMILEKNGLVSFNVHPDYLIAEGPRELYRQLLAHLVDLSSSEQLWMTLPGEVDQWWRHRREMRIINEGGRLRVTGPSSHRAVVAYASLENGRIVYEIPELHNRMMLTSA